jgi:NADPH-dependent curcumin reductase CurA
VNRRFVLRERPTGRIDDRTFELVEEPVPVIGEGEALVRTRWISLDPANRAWLNDTPTYLPPVGIGDVMRASGVGEVVASSSPDYPVGRLVVGRTGWQDYVVASASAPMRAVAEIPGVSPSHFLGALGTTGLTAHIGMLDIGRPKPGETVVVSAAAGAVGSVAGQLAKIQGVRVVGIAGGPEKCAHLLGALGFDAAVDYKAPDWRDRLKAATPDGIDVDFENVGGAIMDHVLMRLNIGARVVLCGMISQYNASGRGTDWAGQVNIGQLIMQRATMQGFLVLDHVDRFEEAIGALAGLLAAGRLHYDETIVDGGLEGAPDALAALFAGTNTGKLVLRVAEGVAR